MHPFLQVKSGADAVLAAYEAVGLGWVVAVFRLPVFGWLIKGTYGFVSKYR